LVTSLFFFFTFFKTFQTFPLGVRFMVRLAYRFRVTVSVTG